MHFKDLNIETGIFTIKKTTFPGTLPTTALLIILLKKALKKQLNKNQTKKTHIDRGKIRGGTYWDQRIPSNKNPLFRPNIALFRHPKTTKNDRIE